MNRQQRRAAGLRSAKFDRKRANSPELDGAYRMGYDRGFRDGVGHTWTMCFAAVASVLRELEKYGPARNERFLRQLDEKMTMTLTSEDAIEEALEKAGVRLNFDGAFPEDRVRAIRR